MAARTARIIRELEIAKRKYVAVGLPREEVGAEVYEGGVTVLQVGIWHEFGFPPNPTRSFLRTPFHLRKDDLSKYIRGEFRKVFWGRSRTETSLGRIGAFAVNISREAFTTKGYGTWPELSDERRAQKMKKGSTSPQILIDRGILRNSITWVVRDA